MKIKMKCKPLFPNNEWTQLVLQAKTTPNYLTVRTLIGIQLLISGFALPIDCARALTNLLDSDGFCTTGSFLHTTLGKSLRGGAQIHIICYNFGKYFKNPSRTNNVNIFLGLSSFFTMIVLSRIRYKMVVEYETEWSLITNETILSIRHLVVWGCSMALGVLVNFGYGTTDTTGSL